MAGGFGEPTSIDTTGHDLNAHRHPNTGSHASETPDPPGLSPLGRPDTKSNDLQRNLAGTGAEHDRLAGEGIPRAAEQDATRADRTSPMNAGRTGDHHEVVIECAGETLILHSQRALYRPATRTLLVADIHLGKESVFGRAGLAMPYGIHPSNLLRLSRLISWYRPDQLMVLGDLMHTAPDRNETWPDEFLRWLKTHSSLDIAVVAGNHDRARARGVFGSQVTWLDEPHVAAPFVYAHQPITSEGLFTLAGHLHPTFLLAGHGDRLRSPVFWFRSNSAVLPAFGTFTGGYNISRIPGDRIFFIGPEEIIEIPPR